MLKAIIFNCRQRKFKTQQLETLYTHLLPLIFPVCNRSRQKQQIQRDGFRCFQHSANWKAWHQNHDTYSIDSHQQLRSRRSHRYCARSIIQSVVTSPTSPLALRALDLAHASYWRWAGPAVFQSCTCGCTDTFTLVCLACVNLSTM